ncbi:MAG: hypothetical protein K9H49_01030 [Bacteroidales bacterium]|nr:hypothetical protein [Bacteroidales bacterium]MCF8403780.1 hypothetical protein [Bacteroidales bacterium]
MSKFRVAYIDEVEEDIRQFQRFASDTFDIIPFLPVPDLDEMVNTILESHVQAIVVDHNLIEFDKTNSINYQGNELIDKINEVMLDFPVFVLTSYDEDAIDNNDDPKIVKEKKIMSATKEQAEIYDQGLKFKRLVVKEIEKHIRKIEAKETRLLELLEISKSRKLTEPEEEEVIRLDNFIESSLNKKSQVPSDLKTISNSERLEELLTKVDKLLSKFEDEYGV